MPKGSIARFSGCLVVCFAMLISVGSAPALLAQPSRVVHVIGNDLGGRIDRRVARVERLRQHGDRVEIRGRICLSACTLYLAADDVCVDADTMFGFHGPSLWGLALDAASFEYWSQLIASQYPAPLRQWYLEVARHRVNGHHRLSGQQMIELGYAPCADPA
ncbi:MULTISPECIES: hypothetical protein [unclassified Ruegeria]|uniref:hypothetical protein n=1 Tax=unclassified Ruegeria TaxID=2625375 RepID=UPI0014888031|nr:MULTISPECIES: hypothetical protein [unclassified Ruegeria]